MSLNIDAFRKKYPYIPGVKGINFEPLNQGTVIPRPYFTESGAPILVTLTEGKVEITPNAISGAVRLLGEMKDSDTVTFTYRTTTHEGGSRYPDMYAKYFVMTTIGFLSDNGNSVNNWFEEWNSGSTNYLWYVGAIAKGADPIKAIDSSWGGKNARANGFSKKQLLTPLNSWMCGNKIQVLYSR